MKDKIIEKLKDKHIAILGFGREGQTTYQFITKYLPESRLTIIDKNDVSKSIETNPNVDFVIGDSYLVGLEKFDLIIKTPGISLVGIDTSAYKDKITSQMELFLECNRDNVIGITGTKGKSTTASLIYNTLKANGKDCILAGNIGVPVFTYLDDEYQDTLFVLEMSSHQLEYLNVSPHIALVLNLFQDHLDHAGTVEAYYRAKMNIFKYQNSNDYMLYYADNDNLKQMVDNSDFLAKEYAVSLTKESDIYLKDGIIYSNGVEVFKENIPRNLLGKHNLINIMFAYKVSEILGLDSNTTLKAISEFQGLDYRLQFIGEVKGIKYYVDTLATIPEATLEAIKAIPDIDTLIIGGMDRGISYEGFADALNRSSVKNFICMPETGHMIAEELPVDRRYIVANLEEAVKVAKEVTEIGKACILSPAAASYNDFKNYQDKGDRYKSLVLQDK